MSKPRFPATGKRIAEARHASGLKQREVAARLDVQPMAVSNWERGNSLPPTGRLADLARELRVSVDWLLLGGDMASTIATDSESATPRQDSVAEKDRESGEAA